MGKKLQKILATLLAVAMLMSMAGVSALAWESEAVAEVPHGDEVRVALPVAETSAGQSGSLRGETRRVESTDVQLMAEVPAETGVASLTLGESVTYYDTLQSALDAAKEAYTADETVIPVVDLLQDVRECVTVGYDPREGYVGGIGYSNYRDSALTLNLNGHTIDGGGQAYFGTWDEATGDRDTHPDASVITVHYNTALTLNGAGADGRRGKVTGGYAAAGGGIMIGNANCGRNPIVPVPEGAKGAMVTIRDLEVSDNYVWFEGSVGRGGGGIALASRQYVARNRLSLDNVLITNNISEYSGGGLFCFRGVVEVTNSEITNNQCSGRGGGIELYENSSCRVENCKINNNTANVSGPDDYLGGFGGGICGESQAILEIIDSEIKDNTAVYGGGGIASVGGFNPEDEELSPDPDPKPDDWQFDCSLVNTAVTGNKATYGGGIYGSWFIVMKITQNSVISNNVANGDGGGGIFLSNYSDLTAANSEINNNSASYGGGIYLYQSDFAYPDKAATVATVTNSKINGNTTSGNGAGVCCDYGSVLTLTNSEINENTTSGGGGGGFTAYYATVTLKDSSVQKNKAETNVGGGIAAWPGTITVDKSAVVNNVSGYGADDIYTSGGDGCSLTIDRAYFGDTVLTADNKPVSGWYRDTSTNRWSEESYCKKAISAGPEAITTTAALWLKAAHGATITYDLQGGALGKDAEGNALTNPVEYAPGVDTFTLNNPSKTGHTFAGWTGSNGETAQTEVSVTKETAGKLSYTANWTVNQYGYTVEYYYDGVKDDGKTVTGADTDYGAKIEGYEAKLETGYKLGKTENLPLTISEDEAKNVIKVYYVTDEAQTKELSYTVEYYKGGVKVDADTQTVKQTVQVLAANTLTVVKDAINTVDKYVGYALKETDPAAIPDTVDSGATIKVYYEAETYTITYDLAGGALAEGVTNPGTYTVETETFTLNDPTRANYTFLGWTGSNGETAQTEVSVVKGTSGNLTYTANWAPASYTITYDLAGGTLADDQANPETYTVETETFTLNNPRRSGYTFTGWTGSNGETAQTEVSVAQGTTGNLTYTANWRRNSSGGGGYVPPTPVNPPEEELEDPDVPLADLPTLNTEDHMAYLIGRPDGTIAPLDNITRGEVATIFFRLLSQESRDANWSTSCGYTDMEGTEYFYNPVSTATKAGLIQGYPDGTFGGGDRITRGEMAAIAARFLSEAYSGEELFTDTQGHWAQEYINRAAKAGWFKTSNADGTPVGEFRPNDYITRAEVVVMINRMLGRKADMEHLLAEMKTWPDNVYSEQTAWYYLDIQEATNSHDYTREGFGQSEVWTALKENPDWAALERR